MKIVLAQLNPVVGDIKGNTDKVRVTIDAYHKRGDLIVFPELFLTGYPPKDLLEKKEFIQRAQDAVQSLVRFSVRFPDVGIVVGAPVFTGRKAGTGLYNAALLVCEGSVAGVQYKTLLPTYDVFDERRYFDPSPDRKPIPFKGEMIGLTVCEDMWTDPLLWGGRFYECDPFSDLAGHGATLFLNISASPFTAGKQKVRFDLVSRHARKHQKPFLFVNQIGGNDELVFDGTSLFVDSSGRPVEVLPSFREEIRVVDTAAAGKEGEYRPLGRVESVRSALVLGLKDYVGKCGFISVVVGLSGGIDSAVTCCLAVEALGKKNVLGISMPSVYSSKGSVEDSKRLAKNLGIEFTVIPIRRMHRSYLDALKESFRGKKEDATEENIQARIRGNILMAFSNKFGSLLLSTGNKSELAVGYCTLYGDMSGGLAVISDVPKTTVYEIARLINEKCEVIPESILTKPPSAELRPDQKDEDTLPPYDILDRILFLYIEERRSVEEITALGFEKETVRWVVDRVNRNEYKRRQAAVGLKVTTKAFGAGRRMPIAARFEG
ncbi:MAG: NAD+ synthase [Spirochaetes bacterium]|nr:NAD+ synthase [Spirochaetota bacterium]